MKEDFYEDDEPIAEVTAAFLRGEPGITVQSVRCASPSCDKRIIVDSEDELEDLGWRWQRLDSIEPDWYWYCPRCAE